MQSLSNSLILYLSIHNGQAVACATAVATYGGATYAAKCEMRDLHTAALHHQVGELAEGTELLESMPEPMCAA